MPSRPGTTLSPASTTQYIFPFKMVEFRWNWSMVGFTTSPYCAYITSSIPKVLFLRVSTLAPIGDRKTYSARVGDDSIPATKLPLALHRIFYSFGQTYTKMSLTSSPNFFSFFFLFFFTLRWRVTSEILEVFGIISGRIFEKKWQLLSVLPQPFTNN